MRLNSTLKRMNFCSEEKSNFEESIDKINNYIGFRNERVFKNWFFSKLGIYTKVIILCKSVAQLIWRNYVSLTYGSTSFLISPLASSAPYILLAFSLLFFYLSSYKFVLISSHNHLSDTKTDIFSSELHYGFGKEKGKICSSQSMTAPMIRKRAASLFCLRDRSTQ